MDDFGFNGHYVDSDNSEGGIGIEESLIYLLKLNLFYFKNA